MKTNRVKTMRGSVLAACMLATLAPRLAIANDDEKRFNRHSPLIGTWDVQVTIRDCQTNAALRTFPSILTYNMGGTLIESTAGMPQAAKTPGHGVWNPTRDNSYHVTFKSLRFDASGNLSGTTVVSQIVNLTHHGNDGESTGTVELRAPNGTLIATGCSTSTSTRLD